MLADYVVAGRSFRLTLWGARRCVRYEWRVLGILLEGWAPLLRNRKNGWGLEGCTEAVRQLRVVIALEGLDIYLYRENEDKNRNIGKVILRIKSITSRE